MKRLRHVAAVLLACSWAAIALASAPVPEGVRVPTWKELSHEQQADLAGLARRWDRLPASRRVLMLERQARWKNLPPGQREALREGAQNFRRMPPPLREKMRRSMRALRGLPDGQRQQLRAQWRSMSPRARRDWLERGGPGIAPPPQASPGRADRRE